VKRLQILENEKDRALRLEQEVSYRTRDLLEANKKLSEEARRRLAVEAEVLRISEMERLRFSLDLHDDICQRLAGISMYCKSLSAREDLKPFLPELAGLIDETLSRTRRYAHDSFPVELDSFGLREAVGGLCGRINKETDCACDYTWKVPSSVHLAQAMEINVYRIVQEALNNVVKHSKADKSAVEIKAEGSVLLVRIKDNGKGNPLLNSENYHKLPEEGRRTGLGLRSMEYRAHQLGAECLFKSTVKGGTLVELRIPIETPHR
jgi:signal transduction histidine kinase